MKRCLITILCLGMLFFSPLQSAAASLPHIIDQDDLLTAAEEAILEDKAAKLSEAYQMDVVILTVYSLDGAFSESYADDYFDNNGYGLGQERSGVLLLLSMEYRDWAISTSGEAILALTDYSIQNVFSDISGYLANDQYFDAFYAYLDALEPYFTAYHDGTPLDGLEDAYDGPGSFVSGSKEDTDYYVEDDSFPILIAPIAGILVAAIALWIMRRQMNTVRPQSGASNYVVGGSVQITKHQDLFLYSKVHKTKKQESSSSHGGGSSVHTGSSGRSHGGGHGKF